MMMKLKHLVSLTLAVISLAACNKQEAPKWEYKIIRQTEDDGITLQEQTMRTTNRMYGKYGSEAMLPIPYNDPTLQLNKLGEQGWELVNVYTTTETVFPNFGNEEYHTGVKSNTRTQTINFIFKRLVKDGEVQSKNEREQLNNSEKRGVRENIEMIDSVSGDSISPYGC